MKDMKVLTKDAKLQEKIGRNHRTDYSSPIKPINALTVQVITELGIVQIDSNHKHLLLVTQLMAQVFKNLFRVSQ